MPSSAAPLALAIAAALVSTVAVIAAVVRQSRLVALGQPVRSSRRSR
jgi:hypothetical protein